MIGSDGIYAYKITKWDVRWARVAEEKYYWNVRKAVLAFEEITKAHYTQQYFDRVVDEVLSGQTQAFYRTDYSYYLQEIEIED